MSELITRRQAAQMIGCDIRTIDNLRKTKRLGFIQITPKVIRIEMSEIQRFLDERRSIARKNADRYGAKPQAVAV
jgi:hypothetical protein